MHFRLSLILAALLPLASCTPPAPGGGSLTSNSVPPSALRNAQSQAGIAPGWFAREFAYHVTTPLAPAGQPYGQPLLDASAATPFINNSRTADDAQRSLDCLTAAVYYEARSEPVDGQRAVAQVVLNRVRNPAFPDSVCGVVYQGSDRSTGCQFTFTCDGSMAAPRDEEAWARSREVARAALAGDVDTDVGLATNYHADWMLPWWASSLDRVATIGSQIFYRWKGALGNALSFTQQYSGVEPENVAAGSAGLPANPGLVRVAVGNGMTIAIHRGGAMEVASSQGSTPAGVRIHRGDMAAPESDSASETADAPKQMISKVTVHRGTSLGEVDPI